MLRIRTFVILIVVYILAFVSIKLDINIFYPYNVLRNYLLYPVVAITKDKTLSTNGEYNKTIILSLQDEINSLKKINNIKTVLADYDNINATVIERNRDYWFNTIIIDKGINDGIIKDMAVIDSDGLIGKINYTTPDTSEIKLISTSDVNNKTSVVIMNDNEKIYGIIEKYQNGFLEVKLASKNIQIKKEMKVMTTGMGGIYPSGILIGTTEEEKKDKYNVGLIVLVKPVSDLNNLKYVSVLKRK